MARSKPTWLINLEYYPIRGVFGLLKILPLTVSEWVSRGLLGLLVLFLPKRRKLIAENLAFCFPERSEAERQQIGRQSLQLLARSIAYLPRLPDHARNLKEFEKWVIPEGLHHVKAAVEKGKGSISLTAHYGFWELLPPYVQLRFPEVYPVARALDNPKLNHLVDSLRTCSGGGNVIPQHDILKQGLKRLRENGMLGLLIDQNFYKGGIFVDFFGRPAATTHIISLLARRTGCAVLPVRSIWEGKRVRIVYEAPVKLSDHPDPETAMRQDTQKMTRIIEGWIREKPEQWLWLHNRWKRTPQPGEVISNVDDVAGVVQR